MTSPHRIAAGAALALVCIAGFAGRADAGPYPVFGPERFIRDQASPSTVTRAFAVLDTGADYTLRIANGGGAMDSVSSAIVMLNGEVIVRTSDFNQVTDVIERTVRLAATNTLSISLASAPESGFDLIILGVDDVPPAISASVSPAPNAAGWNRSDVTVSFTCSDDRSGVAFCPPAAIVTGETARQTVTGTAFDVASNRATAQAVVRIDRTAPVVTFTAPAAGQTTNTDSVTVRVSAADANGVEGVEVGGRPAAQVGVGLFEAVIPLVEGGNTVTAVARDLAGNARSEAIGVTRVSLPELALTSPAPQTLTRFASTTVQGTVSASVVSVSVNGIQGDVQSGSFSVTGVPLFEGNNLLTAVASDATGRAATAAVQVIRDSTAPRVTIHTPADGFLTTAARVNVSGMVNDLIVGSLDTAEARVEVNGIAASVANRSFLAADVPLAIGSNTVTASAVDLTGNTATAVITVHRAEAAGPRVSIVSGDLQEAAAGAELPDALVVRVADGLGAPMAAQPVVFRVTDNNGRLATADESGAGLVVPTDASGEARVRWTLGSRSGAGRNRVDVNVQGVVGGVAFTATGLAVTPHKINVDAGNLQFGIVGRALPRPLVAVVTDAGHNRLPGVPVTFRVVAGGGLVGNAGTVDVETDAYGRALTPFTLGSDVGRDNNLVEAGFEGNTGGPAVFAASGLAAGDPAATRVSGVVLDNTDLPIRGVTVRIEETALTTRTDAQGRFSIDGAPAGRVRLIVDGGSAERPGTWPALEYELVTVPGQDNSVGMPIYLLPIDLARGAFVDEVRGATITLPELPGFSLTVAPGAATFPGGTKAGVVSVTLVHADKVPMVPNFGQQPRFIVTIQPAGVRFDPPAALGMPNVDALAPGEVTEMYSFDHDLGMFVSIGTATVSADGTTLRSDPGVGVIEGGWHCGGNPAASGGAASVSVNITTAEPQKLKKDETVTLSAAGGPQPGSYSWSTDRPDLISFVGPTSGPSASSVQIKGVKGGRARVTVVFTCESGASDTDEITVIVATPDVTVVAFVDGPPLEALRQSLEPDAGFLLKLDLQGPLAALTCILTLGSWSIGIPIDLLSDADRRYANAFLLANSANSAPGAQIDPDAVLAGGDFRLFNRLQASIDPDVPQFEWVERAAAVGITPNPCPVGPSADGEAHPDHGANGFTPGQTGVFQLAEGRLGSQGQDVNETLNGRSTPYIWSVIRFNLQSELSPAAVDHAIFPTYYVYEDGALVAQFPQADPFTFIALDDTYQRLASEVP